MFMCVTVCMYLKCVYMCVCVFVYVCMHSPFLIKYCNMLVIFLIIVLNCFISLVRSILYAHL